jgi:ABC-type sugar transport system ATPase subunit
MAGRAISSEYPTRSTSIGETSLSISGMSRKPKVIDVSLELRKGEVVGITGLVGAGRTELLRLIFGADRADSGRLFLHNKEIEIRSPMDAIRHGICLLTEDRKREGLILAHSIEDNFGLPNLSRFSKWGWMLRQQERKRLSRFASELSIKFASSKSSVQHLSGGNQQKIVMAKWLETNAEIIMLDEPTRGVDIAAKREIYVLIHQLASAGKSILMVSSEFPEILGVCHRTLVMRAGKIAGEIINAEGVTEQDILRLAVQPETDMKPAGTTL